MRGSLIGLALSTAIAGAALADDFEDGFERSCEVHIYGFPHGELECSGDYKAMERQCEAYFHDQESGSLDCKPEFSRLERRCEVVRYSDSYAEIGC